MWQHGVVALPAGCHQGKVLITQWSASVGRLAGMSHGIAICLMILAWLLATPVAAANRVQEYAIGPTPSWVDRLQVVDAGKTVPTAQISDGVYYLLSDYQNRVGARDGAVYRHIAAKAINESGVESIANVEIRFDAAYAKLILHSIDIVRDGRVIPKLATADVRVLQRETALEKRIFDGSKTANVFLGDVRVGDIVEYSYSIEGANPVFGGSEFGALSLQFSVPVERVRIRLWIPQHRRIRVDARNVVAPARVSERDGYRVHEWDSRDVAPLIVEEGAPGWYDVRPTVEWSEYADWASVARWAWSLYQIPKAKAAPIQAEIDRIARAEATPEARMLAALRFVQGEIRYLGISIGPGSHAPNPPALVLERRFGDCKDKARLTMAMLDGLGIQARAALVNTETEKGVKDVQASPGVFDHVVVRAQIGDRVYWIDPTRSPQNGDVAHLQQSNFGYALVVDPATRDLASMETPGNPLNKRVIQAVFDAAAGFEEPVRYTVTTTAEGARADMLRNALATSNRETLQNQYLNFYASYYPGITMSAPLEVVEDASNNRVTTTERYEIANFWATADGARQAGIDVPDVYEVLRDPPAVVRRAPLRRSHPSELSQRTEVLLPEAWSIEEETSKVDDPAFLFERKVSKAQDGRRLVLEDRYVSRTEEVSGEDTPRYAANLARAREATGFRLSWNGSAAAGDALAKFNWPVALVALLLTAMWIALAVAVYRRDGPEPSPPFDPGLAGIGGWLILPAISVVVSPIRIAFDLYGMSSVFALDTWAALTTYGKPTFHALWAPLVLLELGINLALVVFWVLLAVMFFQRRRGVPRLFIAVLLSGVFSRCLDMTFGSILPTITTSAADWVELVRDTFFAVLWAAYFARSVRVRSTFVRPRPGSTKPNKVSPPLASASAMQ